MFEQIKKAIKDKNIDLIRRYSANTPIFQIASDLELLEDKEQVIFFRMLNADISGEVFAFLDADVKQRLITNFTDKMISQVLEELYTDEIADLLEEVPSNVAKRILKNADKETRNSVNNLLNYDDDTVGSIMSVDIIKINSNKNCNQALQKIRKKKNEAELVHYYYVVNPNNSQLIGAVTLEDIVFADDNTNIKEITFPVPSVRTQDTKESAAKVFADNDLSIIPVIDSSSRVVGMLTSDDIIDVIQDEATEDFYKMAGINSDSIIDKDYVKTSVMKLVRSRIFWLCILMLGSTLSQIVIEQFTGVLENNTEIKKIGLSVMISTIVSIIPVIAGAAGNAGSQSATTITRALSLGEIDKKYYMKAIKKEVSVGFVVGIILMLINFLRLILYFSISGDLFNSTTLSSVHHITKAESIWIISFAASFAMFLVIIFSKFLGSVIPLLASKFGKDPAVMSSPILATLTDATSTFIFFGITILVFILL